MIAVTVDGVEVSVPEGATVLDAAKAAGRPDARSDRSPSSTGLERAPALTLKFNASKDSWARAPVESTTWSG